MKEVSSKNQVSMLEKNRPTWGSNPRPSYSASHDIPTAPTIRAVFVEKFGHYLKQAGTSKTLKGNETIVFGNYYRLEGEQTFHLIYILAILASWIP